MYILFTPFCILNELVRLAEKLRTPLRIFEPTDVKEVGDESKDELIHAEMLNWQQLFI